MAESSVLADFAVPDVRAAESPRHSLLVRVTHWITALGFLGLLVSGIAILLAHPRLYWGEAGALGTPSLIDLPLPFVLQWQIRGPGRYLHFLSAWICVLTGLVYVVTSAYTRHFRKRLWPSKSDLAWKNFSRVVSDHLLLRPAALQDSESYNVLQRLTYLAVIFVLFPLAIWTGLAMSPAVVSVFPFLATVFGGQQSARTIHFFVAASLVLFLVVHVAMVYFAGFKIRMRAMLTGRSAGGKEPS